MCELRWSRSIGRRWQLQVDVSFANWTFGVHYENALLKVTIAVGPLVVSFGRTHEAFSSWPAGSLYVWRSGDRKLRLDWSTHQMLFGYSRASARHQGIYLGPLDLQIERRNAKNSDLLNPLTQVAGMTTITPIEGKLLDVIAAWRARRPDWFETCLIAFGPGECDGWADLLDGALDQLGAITRQNPAYTLRLQQINEKFGSLRVYFKREIGSPADVAIEALLSDLHERFEGVCQLCGRPGTLGAHHGCVVVRCVSAEGRLEP